MKSLVLDASGAVASVALFDGHVLSAHGEVAMRNREREPLLPLIMRLCAEAGWSLDELGRVVVGAGPGAFTSLRIAAATAKGLVHGTAATLHVVPSLVLAAASADDAPLQARRVMTSDALRGDRYVQAVERTTDGWVSLGDAIVVAAPDIGTYAASHGAGQVLADVPVQAKALLAVAPSCTRVVDVATWEPAYGRLAEAQVKWEAANGRALPLQETAMRDGT